MFLHTNAATGIQFKHFVCKGMFKQDFMDSLNHIFPHSYDPITHKLQCMKNNIHVNLPVSLSYSCEHQYVILGCQELTDLLFTSLKDRTYLHTFHHYHISFFFTALIGKYGEEHSSINRLFLIFLSLLQERKRRQTQEISV